MENSQISLHTSIQLRLFAFKHLYCIHNFPASTAFHVVSYVCQIFPLVHHSAVQAVLDSGLGVSPTERREDGSEVRKRASESNYSSFLWGKCSKILSFSFVQIEDGN